METTDVDKPLFLTGHSVFDQIFYLRRGMTVLLSDETFSEGRSFLRVLLKNHRSSMYELVSARFHLAESNQFSVPVESLQDLSIYVNQKRRTEKGKIFVHLYLPELLIRHSPEEVLKVMELWQKDVLNAGNIEFYLLPRNTFADFERKARAIVDAVIDIQVVKQETRFLYYFTPMRSCSPRHHLKGVQFEISDSKLLIEWEGVLVDSLPSKIVTASDIRKKIETKEKEMVLKVNNIEPDVLTVNDYVILTSLDGMPLWTVKMLYPDRWPEVEEKIIQWAVSGVLGFDEAKSEKVYESRKGLKLRNRLLLSVPTQIALYLVSLSKGFLGKRVRTVPLDAHLAVLEAMKNIVDLAAAKNPEVKREAKLATRYFGELSARKTALEYVIRLEGTPYTNFRLEYAPKLVAISLKAGWGLDVNFISEEKDSWLFEIKKCHLCEDVHSDEPFCDKFVSSVVSGVLGVCLKRQVECHEITCRAMGSDKCTFRASLV
ncbi:MAG: V4R domain-containing protein [Candidatus Caldarchaeum sp.]|nr:hypothetical protein [Candidatus Caldarchaeum sp.]MDW8062728.1 V4R domain-containing protein [Candidatus Caldarchaeum sp.]